jgi:tetraacyldisaccharide 4'-kinase
MKAFPRLADRIRRGGSLPAPLALALSACTPALRAGMFARRLRRVHRVDARVVSFGNITAGGTGKTPAVIERAQAEIAAGHRVAVLTRGYAAPSGRRPADSTALGGESPYHALGDEAALILQKIPGVIVIKNADRVAGAHRAIAQHKCDVLLLDDGFQYLRLARDEDIVLVDATDPFGNDHLLPRGVLREPLSALRRATQLIVTRADQSPDTAGLQARLHALAPGVPVRLTTHAPSSLRNHATGESRALDSLEGQAVTVFCGIGNPESLVATLTSLGAKVGRVIAKGDHVSAQEHEVPRDGLIVTTEKDAVRDTLPRRQNIFILGISLRDYS